MCDACAHAAGVARKGGYWTGVRFTRYCQEDSKFLVSAANFAQESPGIPAPFAETRTLPNYRDWVAGAGGFEPPYGAICIHRIFRSAGAFLDHASASTEANKSRYSAFCLSGWVSTGWYGEGPLGRFQTTTPNEHAHRARSTVRLGRRVR
jgi:hypothetical protein